MRPRMGVVTLLAAVTLGVGACGGSSAESKSTAELIATVRNTTVGTGPRCSAAEELGKRKAKETVSALNAVVVAGPELPTTSFAQAQWKVASCVAGALGAIGDPQAVPPLLKALGKTTQTGPKFYGFFPDKAKDAFVAMGPAAVPTLMLVVAAGNAAEYRLGHDHACIVAPMEGREPCPSASEDANTAVTALDWIGDRRAEPVLVSALSWAGPAASEALAVMYRRDVDHLLPLLQSNETFQIYTGLIRLGKTGTEPALKDALMRFGNKEMAEEYLNSGNAALAAAADEWARANGYYQGIPTFGTGTKPPWGTL